MWLLQNGYITYEEALVQSTNPDDFALRVSGVESGSGDGKWEDFEAQDDDFEDGDDDFDLDEFEIERF